MQITRANIYTDICVRPWQTRGDISAHFRFIKLHLILAKQLQYRCIYLSLYYIFARNLAFSLSFVFYTC